MRILFLGLTFLVAHTVFFATHDSLSFIRAAMSGGKTLWLSYAIAACLVGLFFKFCQLPSRLSRPLRGRHLVALGTFLYFVHAAIFFTGISSNRPGLYLIIQLSSYVASLAMLFILLGSALALLGFPSTSTENQREF